MQFQKFRSNNPKPSEPPPSDACDCQIHVFGDPGRYPVRPDAAYTPFADATIDAALAMHRSLGFSRGIIVQATTHGTDHRILYDALECAGANYKGVAVINESVGDKELQRLHDAGVRGARFNFWKQLNLAPSWGEFRRSIHRIKDLGWLAKIHAAGDEWLELEPLLTGLGVPVVVDHFGHLDISKGLDQPAVKLFRTMLRNEDWYIMISNADRYSSMTSGWHDAAAFLKDLIALAPDRMIWSSDWPHVQYRKPMPTDTELLELLYRTAPDPAVRRNVLCATPQKLFRL